MFTKKTRRALIKAVLTKKSPVYVQFAVTKRCNLACSMCDSTASRSTETELSLPQIRVLADVLDELGAGVVLLTGGEPFIRPDIAEIINIFAAKGCTVRLQTNGILASQERIASAVQAGLREVTISLESLDHAVQDGITGQKGSWEKIVAAIARFSQLLPCRSSLLGVNTVVSRYNLEEIPDIVRFVSSIGFYCSLIPVHVAAHGEGGYIIRKQVEGFSFAPQDFPALDRVYGQVIAMKRRGLRVYNSYKFLRNSPDFLKKGRVAWRCDSPHLYFAISPSGKFLPCVDVTTDYSMIEDGFVRRFRSAEFQEMVAQKVKGCPGCYYACWPEMSYLCRDAGVLAERIFLSAGVMMSRRVPVSYEDCMTRIAAIKNSKKEHIDQ